MDEFSAEFSRVLAALRTEIAELRHREISIDQPLLLHP